MFPAIRGTDFSLTNFLLTFLRLLSHAHRFERWRLETEEQNHMEFSSYKAHFSFSSFHIRSFRRRRVYLFASSLISDGWATTQRHLEELGRRCISIILFF